MQIFPAILAVIPLLAVISEDLRLAQKNFAAVAQEAGANFCGYLEELASTNSLKHLLKGLTDR